MAAGAIAALASYTPAGKTEAAKTLNILRRSSEAGAPAARSLEAAPGPLGSSAFTASEPRIILAVPVGR
eukprot:scaffold47514_cov63-Phaeocystis_antarctica.AAC.1